MYTVFVAIHVLNCLVLCVIILLQSSKGGGLAGTFGGAGAPQQVFGTRGMTTILHKMTIYCAIGFFATSGVLFALTAHRNRAPRSIVQDAASRGTLTSDVTPPAPSEDFTLPVPPGAGAPGAEAGPETEPLAGEEAGATEAATEDDNSQPE